MSKLFLQAAVTATKNLATCIACDLISRADFGYS
jgi:hypothetical protein